MSMSFTSASSSLSMRGPASTFVSQNNFVVGLASATALENADTAAPSGARAVRRDASRLKERATANALARELGRKLLILIMKPKEDLVTSTPLANLRMDSLFVIEMRTWWRQTFGSDTSVLEIMGLASLGALGLSSCAQGLLNVLEGGYLSAAINSIQAGPNDKLNEGIAKLNLEGYN
ncbi:hypothetical protein G7046_g5502 [Stylonectria norvegica]|nr:hypothetical protein G7046_g5502 [Stylonectria norvegica]